jgi:hypothetical protein
MTQLVQRFVILCWARTGSYYLTNLLDQHPLITCHEEVFKSHRMELRKSFLHCLGLGLGLGKDDVSIRDSDPLGFLDRLEACSETPLVGFKLFPSHNNELLEHVLLDHETRKVLLMRNPLQIYVSLLNARKSGQWTLKRKYGRQPRVRLHFDREEFFREALSCISFYERCLTHETPESDNPLFPLDYQNLHDPATHSALASFLGVGPWPSNLRTSYFKQLRRPYEDIVDNWPAVIAMCEELGVDHTATFEEFSEALHRFIHEYKETR